MKNPDFKSSLGDAIKNARSDLRITQEELAERAGLHRTYVSDVERGRRNISLENIEKLADALKLSISKLFARAGDGASDDPFVEILLIEDNEDDAELAVRSFRKAKITNVLHVACDGEEALDFLFATGAHERRKNQPLPGVILLDLNLPKIDGLEVLRRIKADKRLRHIPVVVLTVSKHDRDIAACRALGAESYIVKPVDFQNFIEVTPHLELGWTLMKTPSQPNE
jgi:CheY-like chemotaxis protein/DNA-binding Xre family transcriptional regulator